MNGQQEATILRLKQQPEKWFRRRELPGTARMKTDLENLVSEGYIETMELRETIGTDRIVTVKIYRLSARERARVISA